MREIWRTDLASLYLAALIYLGRVAARPAATAGSEMEMARLRRRQSAQRDCEVLPL